MRQPASDTICTECGGSVEVALDERNQTVCSACQIAEIRRETEHAPTFGALLEMLDDAAGVSPPDEESEESDAEA